MPSRSRSRSRLRRSAAGEEAAVGALAKGTVAGVLFVAAIAVWELWRQRRRTQPAPATKGKRRKRERKEKEREKEKEKEKGSLSKKQAIDSKELQQQHQLQQQQAQQQLQQQQKQSVPPPLLISQSSSLGAEGDMIDAPLSTLGEENKSATRVELLLHNVSHTDMVLSCSGSQNAALPVDLGQANPEELIFCRPKFSDYRAISAMVFAELARLQQQQQQLSIALGGPGPDTGGISGGNDAGEGAGGSAPLIMCPVYTRDMNTRELVSLPAEMPAHLPVGFDLAAAVGLSFSEAAQQFSFRRADEAKLQGAALAYINGVYFPLLALLLDKWIRAISHRTDSRTQHVIFLVTGVGLPRNRADDAMGNSTEMTGHLMRQFIHRLLPNVHVELVHSNLNLFRYDDNIDFVKNDLLHRVDRFRDPLAEHYGAAWMRRMRLTISFADGSPARITAINASLRHYRPSFMHTWQLKSFWHEAKICDDDIEMHSFEEIDTTPAVHVEALTDYAKLAAEEMARMKAEFEEIRSGKKKHDLKSFWLRKTKKPVFAVLVVHRDGDGSPPRIFRGTNMEVSMPTGSLCAERNVIGTALAADLTLNRKDLKLVAVLSVTLSPAAPEEAIVTLPAGSAVSATTNIPPPPANDANTRHTSASSADAGGDDLEDDLSPAVLSDPNATHRKRSPPPLPLQEAPSRGRSSDGARTEPEADCPVTALSMMASSTSAPAVAPQSRGLAQRLTSQNSVNSETSESSKSSEPNGGDNNNGNSDDRQAQHDCADCDRPAATSAVQGEAQKQDQGGRGDAAKAIDTNGANADQTTPTLSATPAPTTPSGTSSVSSTPSRPVAGLRRAVSSPGAVDTAPTTSQRQSSLPAPPEGKAQTFDSSPGLGPLPGGKVPPVGISPTRSASEGMPSTTADAGVTNSPRRRTRLHSIHYGSSDRRGSHEPAQFPQALSLAGGNARSSAGSQTATVPAGAGAGAGSESEQALQVQGGQQAQGNKGNTQQQNHQQHPPQLLHHAQQRTQQHQHQHGHWHRHHHHHATPRNDATVLVQEEDMNPLKPCGACSEWLKKIAEVNPRFTVMTFTDWECQGAYLEQVGTV